MRRELIPFPILRSSFVAALLLAASIPALANVFDPMRGVVHDLRHRPVAGAVRLQLSMEDSHALPPAIVQVFPGVFPN
jgi:hypothetical protein